MAFCKYCGTQLQEGELCTCEKAVASRTVVEPTPAPAPAQEAPAQEAAPAQNPTYPPYPNMNKTTDPNEVLNKIVEVVTGLGKKLVGVYKKPVDESVAYVNEANFINALIFMALEAFGVAFFALAQMGKISKLFGDEALITLLKTFLFSYIGTAVVAGLFIGLFFIIFKVIKVDVDIMKILSFVSLKSIVATPIILVALLFTFINAGVGLVIFFFAAIMAFAILMQGMEAFTAVDKNVKGYVVAIASIIVCAVLAIVFALFAEAIVQMIARAIFASAFQGWY